EKQQYADQREAERHDDRKAPDRFLQFAELADPFEAIAGRQLHLLRDLLLRFEDGAAKVAPAHAEFDRNVALLVLAIDERGAGNQFHRGDIGQRDRHHAIAARVWRADRDAADRIE